MIDIRDLLKSGEGITVEFKEAKRELNKDTFDSVCAMLNGFGGHLFLGVDDDGNVCGIDSDCIEKIKRNFSTQINNPDKLSPTVYINLKQFDIDDKIILYAQIPDSPEVHRTAGKIFELRLPMNADAPNTPQDTPQDERKYISGKFEDIIIYCSEPRSRKEMQDFVGIKDAKYFKNFYLSPLINRGILKMTIPDKPTSKNQKYISIKK